ncbi:MAG: lipid A biosynthesis acyltransferase, partial [Gammaproteobacteria bacterium]
MQNTFNLVLRNLPKASALGLLWLLTRLPFRLQMRLGSRIGDLIYRFHHKRRHIAEVNLRLCFPDTDPALRQKWLKAHFRSLGMTLFETGMAWWPKRHFPAKVKIEGLEHLREPLSQGQGVLMLGAHFTTLDIGGYLLSREQDFCVIYREHKNPLFESVMRRARTRNFQAAIQRRSLRTAIRHLREGQAVWYAPDQ